MVNPVRILRESAGLRQAQLADAARTSQPTIAAYESGSKSPTWSTVQRLARAVGREPHVEFVPPLTREDRRSLALHAAIARRLREDPSAVLARAQRNVASLSTQHPGARPLLDEWRVLLRRPLSALLPVLRDPSPWARELRHATPFAGVLTARERALVYRTFAAAEQSPLHQPDAVAGQA